MAKKILLIEDEKILLEMYKEKFSQEGYEMILSIDAEKGLKLAKKEKPDLIILDILLPEKDGIFLLEERKKDPEIASIPVVALSNYDHPDVRKKALELGAKEYIIKTDFTPQEIVEKIKHYLPK
ncbi:response regulator [Patescibacteria group bacterium]|nr:response regulator [Patescibacteria group bacterium]